MSSKKIHIEHNIIEKRNTDYKTNPEKYENAEPLEYYINGKYIAYIHPAYEYESGSWGLCDEFYDFPEAVQQWIAFDMIKEIFPKPQKKNNNMIEPERELLFQIAKEKANAIAAALEEKNGRRKESKNKAEQEKKETKNETQQIRKSASEKFSKEQI